MDDSFSQENLHKKTESQKHTSLMTAFTAGEVAKPLLAILLTKAITLLLKGGSSFESSIFVLFLLPEQGQSRCMGLNYNRISFLMINISS